MKRLILALGMWALVAPGVARADIYRIEQSVVVTPNLTFPGTLTTGTLSVTGVAYFADGTAALPSGAFLSDPDTGFFNDSANVIGFTAGGAERLSISTSILKSFTNVFYMGSSSDIRLIRIAADHLGMYRTTSAQKFSVAGTSDGGSNYERGYIYADSTAFTVGHEAGGTGTVRPVKLSSTAGIVVDSPVVMGGTSVALVEGSATTVGTVTVTDGEPYLGKALFGVFCSDGTDFVSRTGEATVACVAKSGTVTCTEYTTVDSGDAASGGASFSGFTIALTEGTNDVDLTINATCSLTQTTLDGYVTWRNLTLNSVAPGT